MLKQLLNDEAGFVVSSELVLVATIAVIGLISGMTTIRDGVVQELADLSGALGNISQSYNFNAVVGHSGASNGSLFQDQTDFCEAITNGGAATAPSCLDFITTVGGNEGTTADAPNGT